MRKIIAGFVFFFLLHIHLFAGKRMNVFMPDNPFIQYMGRIDFSNSKLPRFWQPGVSVFFNFKGNKCDIIVRDEVLWGKNHNYVEIVVDGTPYRLQLTEVENTLHLKGIKGAGTHTVIFTKTTEAGIGYLELVSIHCKELLQHPLLPQRKIEFIGNSITCGMGNDESKAPCKSGEWYDQNNSWFSYGAITARVLNSQYHLSSVSGIGLIHSCCNMEIKMPQVFDKISMRDNKILWNFSNYQPDIVSICLGQNDGIQDSTAFVQAYVSFLERLHTIYPKAKFLLLSSPMADEKLRSFMRSMLASITSEMHRKGLPNVFHHVFINQYIKGCDSHPSLREHQQIADEVTTSIKRIMSW